MNPYNIDGHVSCKWRSCFHGAIGETWTLGDPWTWSSRIATRDRKKGNKVFFLKRALSRALGIHSIQHFFRIWKCLLVGKSPFSFLGINKKPMGDPIMTSRIFKLRRPRFINLKNLYSWPSLLYSFKRYTPFIFQENETAPALSVYFSDEMFTMRQAPLF